MLLGAVAYCAVATYQAADDGQSGTGDEHEEVGGDFAGDVRDDEDESPGVHQDGGYQAERALRHTVTSCCLGQRGHVSPAVGGETIDAQECTPANAVCASTFFGHLGVGEEAVADAADGDEVLGGAGVVFYVAAQADDEVIDGAGVRVFMDTPDLLEDVLAGDDLAFAFGQVAEQVGLHEGEVRGGIGGDEFERVEANGAVIKGVLLRGGGGSAGAEGSCCCQLVRRNSDLSRTSRMLRSKGFGR